MIPGTGNAWRIRVAALVLMMAPVLLVGCASGPLDIPDAVGDPVPPRSVTADSLPAEDQVWGGVIARVDNRADSTVIEVVSYPLQRQEPQTRQANTGRFRLKVDGFADPVDYRPGRRVTAVGTVSGTEEGSIGELAYVFPLLDAYSVHLWPDPEPPRPSSGVRFGIGIGIGL
ncbi:Slp family lipoprotein [Thioalkalivibrio sp. K90mix]|uniref:Slp family lipoprotein n=1 Tax=Thioalkalivibrio sp. (strain K90mix) TaxID=396595 RepID=UPI000195979A|nr:Slp family lipoprotein [Thioalkalivibrio sp. K90mix]